MVKIIYVAGERGAGKSTFITDNYQGEEFFILNMGKESKMAEDTSEKDEAIDILCEIFNRSMDGLMEAYFDEKTIVIEICVGTENDESFIELVNQGKIGGATSELVMLDCDYDERMARITKTETNEDYFSSAISTENVLEVTSEFFNSIGVNKKLGYIE